MAAGGVWLATSNDIQGLTGEAEKLTDLVQWSREIARDLIEMHAEMAGTAAPPPLGERFSLPVVLAA